jgi:hypothetical protein
MENHLLENFFEAGFQGYKPIEFLEIIIRGE